MEKPYDDILENIKRVRETMVQAAIAAGRNPEEVQLLGVTKTVSPDRINAALDAGITAIGENRVQEFLGKRDALLLNRSDGSKTAVHLIGHLQTNTVSKIVGLVDMIESIDSVHLAKAVSDASQKIGGATDVLVEVNIGREEAKSGVFAENLDGMLDEIRGFPGIRVRGLMTVPPILETEKEKRAIFSQMYKLFIDIKAKNRDNDGMDTLSMGMSGDYREAILEGATLVRVGSALFGRRYYPPR